MQVDNLFEQLFKILKLLIDCINFFFFWHDLLIVDEEFLHIIVKVAMAP